MKLIRECLVFLWHLGKLGFLVGRETFHWMAVLARKTRSAFNRKGIPEE